MDAIDHRIFVVVATRGRASETSRLMTALAHQTVRPARVVVVGTEAADIAGVAQIVPALQVEAVVASQPGLTRQRNAGVNLLGPLGEGDIVVFFDDDFRPAKDWLRHAMAAFRRDLSVAALSGQVLADGALGAAITEDEAQRILSAPQPAVGSGPAALYGCNMAIRGSMFATVRFDEDLPSYGWLEDRDMQGRLARRGRLIGEPLCVGVHLGVKGARISGRRFGYSQIANPIHLHRNRTIGAGTVARLVLRAFASNLGRSPFGGGQVDHRGRLRGNMVALRDLMLRRLHPGGIRGL